jgi:hypothetical protein
MVFGLVVAEATINALQRLDVCFKLDSDKRKELKKARAALQRTT